VIKILGAQEVAARTPPEELGLTTLIPVFRPMYKPALYYRKAPRPQLRISTDKFRENQAGNGGKRGGQGKWGKQGENGENRMENGEGGGLENMGETLKEISRTFGAVAVLPSTLSVYGRPVAAQGP